METSALWRATVDERSSSSGLSFVMQIYQEFSERKSFCRTGQSVWMKLGLICIQKFKWDVDTGRINRVFSVGCEQNEAVRKNMVEKSSAGGKGMK